MAGLRFTRALTAGETIAQTVSFADAPATTHTVSYTFRHAAGSLTVAGTVSGTDFTVTVPAADTARWDAGVVAWSAMATETATGVVSLVDSGTLTLAPNPAAETYARRVLTAVRALIEGRADAGQVTTGLEGLQLQHLTPAELLQLEADFAARVQSELRAASVASGTAQRRRVYTRFTERSA